MASRYGISLADIDSAATRNTQGQMQMSDWKKGREEKAQMQDMAGQMAAAETPEERRDISMQMATLSPEKASAYQNFYTGLDDAQRAEARRVNDEGRKTMAYVQDVIDSGGDPQQAWDTARKHAPPMVAEFMTETFNPSVHQYGLIHFAEIDEVNQNLESRRDFEEQKKLEAVRKDRKETAPTKYSRYGKKELRDNIEQLLTTQGTDALGQAVDELDQKQVQKFTTRVEALRKQYEDKGDDELITMVAQEMGIMAPDNAPPPGQGAVNMAMNAVERATGVKPDRPAPQAAIDALRKDPSLAEQFKAKYGYIP